jgi:hypothetical protein
MKKIIFFVCIIFLLVSCAKKRNDAIVQENDVSSIHDEAEVLQADDESKPHAMYVNSKDGLRVRDMPGVAGNILDVLPHKSKIVIVGKSEQEDNIDGITGCWYSMKMDELQGWVFGGYLKETVEEIGWYEFAEQFAGFYAADEVEVLLEEGFSYRNYFTIQDNGLIDMTDIYFEITHVSGDEFLFIYHFPFFESGNPEYDRGKFHYSEARDGVFFGLAGESSGGIYLNFYHKGETIIMDLYEVRGNWENDDDTRSFRCMITFKKNK